MECSADRSPRNIGVSDSDCHPVQGCSRSKTCTECLPDLLAGLEGACDCFHPSIDRLPKIGMLIAAANTVKVGSGPMDQWMLDEPNLRWVRRRVRRWRKERFDPE